MFDDDFDEWILVSDIDELREAVELAADGGELSLRAVHNQLVSLHWDSISKDLA